MGGRVYPRTLHSTRGLSLSWGPVRGRGAWEEEGIWGTFRRSLPVPRRAQAQIWDADTHPEKGIPFPLANASVLVTVLGPGCLPLGLASLAVSG